MFILNDNYSQLGQHESMATTYMNRFAMNEDDWFEIHVKHCTHPVMAIDENEIHSVVEEVMFQAHQGSGFFRDKNLDLFNEMEFETRIT